MAIRWDKLTVKAQEAVQRANDVASEHGNPEVAPAHLLLALAEDREGIVPPILEKIGVNPRAIAGEARAAVEKLPKVSGSSAAQAHLSNELSKVIDQAFKEANNFKDEYVSTEHLLLGLAESKKQRDEAAQILAAHGATRDAILKALTSIRGTQKVTDQNPEAKYQALERYARDLTDLARRGKHDPALGRDEDIRRVVAGAAEGAIDASNMLKPALARGELRAIGATTLNEYRKYIEKDAALERRFQIVFVGEPNVEDTIAILRGLKERYEVHHGVRIKDSAIVAAATLSHRYISDRFLPDKAIDLIDEAAASLRIQIDSMPTEIDQLER